MVQEDNLSSVLSEFARTMVTDFPIQRILDSLVERIVTILPITAAGVTLIAEGEPPRYIAASDESAMRFERLQSEIGEGPCLLAYSSGESVAVPDLAAETRFPKFTPAAQEAGLVAVFTFPLRHGRGAVLGALDIYRDTAGALTEPDMKAAQTLADVAAAYLLNAEAREETEQTAERFQHSSLHDALTGLPNGVLLRERVVHAADRARRSHNAAAVLFVDLDRFKQVNDSHGHHVGDTLLIAVAQRLSQVARSGDTLSRVSGDEFVLLCEDLDSADAAEVIATRINEAFAEPYVAGGLHLVVTASVGIAYAGPGEEISDQLIMHADKAMYRAKRRGGDGHHIIDLRETLQSNTRNGLETDLPTAMSNGELATRLPAQRSNRGQSLTAYFRTVEAFDAHEASDLVVKLLDEGTPVETITREVLAPAQVRVGQLWESGRWSVADEHVATSLTEGALSALMHAATPRRRAHARHVAVACAEGEWHSLPARMAAAVAGATGEARVTMLGPSLPAEQLYRRLSAGDIDLLALSCTMPTSLIGAARCIAAAHELYVPVIVGGRALGDGPLRAHAIGADGWAIDAEVLVNEPVDLAGRSSRISTEVLLLDAVDDAIISLAYDRMVAAFPRLSGMTRYQQARTREDLGWMARHTAAALLTNDASIVEDLLTWLCGLLRGKVPASVITTSAQLLAETLEPQTATGAAILRDAAAKVDNDMTGSTDNDA